MRCLDYNPGIALLIWQLELTDWSFFYSSTYAAVFVSPYVVRCSFLSLSWSSVLKYLFCDGISICGH